MKLINNWLSERSLAKTVYAVWFNLYSFLEQETLGECCKLYSAELSLHGHTKCTHTQPLSISQLPGFIHVAWTTPTPSSVVTSCTPTLSLTPKLQRFHARFHM